MGFNQDIRKVKDPELPIEHRYVALRSAVTRFSPNGFNSTFSNLATAVGREEPSARWTASQLDHAAGLLDQSRDLYIQRRRQWDDERRRNKTRGIATATSAEVGARDSPSWFDRVSAGDRSTRKWVSLTECVEEQGTTPAPFGAELVDDLRIVMDAMGSTRHQPAGRMIARHGPYPKRHEPSNVVAIPYRVQNDPISDSSYEALSTTQRTMADCLYSRSSDGHTRQRHLKRIVGIEQLWVVPFVVVALGDYVVEIVNEVAAGLTQLDEPNSWQDSQYRLFADHNAELVDLMRQRSTSYWHRYYRTEFALHADSDRRPRYPSFQILDAIGVNSYPLVYRSQA